MHEDKKFEKYIDEIELPQNTEEIWMKGINKAKKEEEAINLKKILKYSGITAALLALGIFIGVKTSPTFASGLEQLIFGRKINQYTDDTDFIKSREEGVGVKLEETVPSDNDKIESAYEVIGENVTLRVTEAYADSENLFIIYEIEATKEVDAGHAFFIGTKPKGILDENGNRIQMLGMRTMNIEKIESDETVTYKGYMQIKGVDRFDLKKNIHLLLKVDSYNIESRERESVIPDAEFIFPEIELKEENYALNKEIFIGEDKLSFKSLTVSPLRSTLEMNLSPDIPFNILDVKSVIISDGKGNQWTNISSEKNNGLLDFANNIIKVKVSMESFYYNVPDELYLESIVLQVLDKDDSVFTIDINNKKVQEPYDSKIELLSVEEDGENALLSLKYADENDLSNFTFRIMNPLDEIPCSSETYIDLNTTRKYEYIDDYVISRIRFPKVLLRDQMKCEILSGAGEIKTFELNYKIK